MDAFLCGDMPVELFNVCDSSSELSIDIDLGLEVLWLSGDLGGAKARES